MEGAVARKWSTSSGDVSSPPDLTKAGDVTKFHQHHRCLTIKASQIFKKIKFKKSKLACKPSKATLHHMVQLHPHQNCNGWLGADQLTVTPQLDFNYMDHLKIVPCQGEVLPGLEG